MDLQTRTRLSLVTSEVRCEVTHEPAAANASLLAPVSSRGRRAPIGPSPTRRSASRRRTPAASLAHRSGARRALALPRLRTLRARLRWRWEQRQNHQKSDIKLHAEPRFRHRPTQHEPEQRHSRGGAADGYLQRGLHGIRTGSGLTCVCLFTEQKQERRELPLPPGKHDEFRPETSGSVTWTALFFCFILLVIHFIFAFICEGVYFIYLL